MKLTYKHTRLACYCASSVSAVINNFTPLLFVIFQREYGISMAQLSLLITLNFGIQAVVDFLGAYFVDKTGYKPALIFANILAAAGLIFLGVLPNILPPYIGLGLGVATYAVGSGLLEVVVSPTMEALPSEKKAASMSFLHSFYCWGQVVTVLVTTLFFTIFGTEHWKIMCVLWSLFPMITAVFFFMVPVLSFTDQKNKVPTQKLFGMKIFWIFLILMMCSGAAELAMAQWASLFAETALSISKTAGDIFGPCLFAVTMGISRVLYGKLSHKIKLENYIILSSILCILSYLAASLSNNSIMSLAGCALCGFSVGVMWPGTLSLAAQKCSQGGTAIFAILALAGDVGCCSGPSLAALVSERFSIHSSPLKAGLLACAVFPIVMIVCSFGLKNMRGEKN